MKADAPIEVPRSTNQPIEQRLSYAAQLRLLPETYEWARETDLAGLREALHAARGKKTFYVGSGGALAVARLAADLHTAVSSEAGVAATPLEYLRMSSVSNQALVLFTASGRHPDAAAVVKAALRGRAHPVVVVTHRDSDDLPPEVSAKPASVVTLPTILKSEGFLATNSVLSMSTALVAANDFDLPTDLPAFSSDATRSLRDNVLVLSAPGLAAAATDLETRLSETGLSGVQVTDYRNFAHGRHTGLARRLDRTSVVALVSSQFHELAERTLRLLPPTTDVVQLESKLPWPGCVLDLLVSSMKAVSHTAESAGVDPSTPRVPEFGRRLYRLSARRLIPKPASPIDRKLDAAKLRRDSELRSIYETSFEVWRAGLQAESFRGIVMDYDGTVCTTDGRFDLPAEEIQQAILGLLQAGVVVGFASGRGSSLYRDLRAWVPQPFWPHVVLGLYNGGLSTSLSEETERSDSGAAGWMRIAAKRLEESPLLSLLEMKERDYQIALQPKPSSNLDLAGIRQVIEEILATPPSIPVRVAASAHSLDVIPTDSTKVDTLKRVSEIVGGPVLAIGDQGHGGGNDFELLAATTWSLSVDRVSADPTRCWNLDVRGDSGPYLLKRYLDSFRLSPQDSSFRVKR
jgi:hydroxymethylpyrimidine pyrophosphatase-like HAD family hydrolase